MILVVQITDRCGFTEVQMIRIILVGFYPHHFVFSYICNNPLSAPFCNSAYLYPSAIHTVLYFCNNQLSAPFCNSTYLYPSVIRTFLYSSVIRTFLLYYHFLIMYHSIFWNNFYRINSCRLRRQVNRYLGTMNSGCWKHCFSKCIKNFNTGFVPIIH